MTSARTLSPRALNRAMLARQLLLERADLSIETAVEQVGGLQTQYAPSGYVGLWTRLAGFRRDALTAALEDRRVIQATLMRTTIHVVSRREFWRSAAGIRQARRAWALRVGGSDEATMIARAERLRETLGEGPRTVRELGDLARGFAGSLGVWLDLVRVPPSGTWERRRADRLALAPRWRRRALLLRAFGPAPWRDIATWAGISVADTQRGGGVLALRRYRDEAGRELVDLPDAPLPDPDVAAPVRFLPHWDAMLLAHARRTGILPEEHRPRVFTTKNPFSVGAYLVDGRVAGAWSAQDGRIVLDPYEELAPRDRTAVEEEREALQAFYA